MQSPQSEGSSQPSDQIIPYERPFLYSKQETAFFCTQRYSYVEASTKAGKTHACIVWIVEKAVLEGFKGWNGWWVAPTLSQAKIAYRRIKNALPKDYIRYHDQDCWIEFPNHARIWFKSAERPDNLYGEDVYAAVLDEASRARYDSFLAIRSTLTATRGQFRLIGNVKGKSNWFYMACRGVERGRENALYSRITAWDAVAAGILDQAEIEDARATLPENDFRELYEAVAADDEDAFLPSEYVERAVQRYRDNCVQPHGALIIGGDPSQGKHDPASFCLRRGGLVERIEEHPGMDEFGFVAHAIRLIEVERPTKMFIDGTGFGTTIGKLLAEQGYGSIVKAVHMAERSTFPDEYANKRAECWGEGRKWLISKDDLCALPDDDGFCIELTCIKKKPNSSGRLLLESKEDLKARGYDSPNKADAWSLTFAEPVAFYSNSKINYPKGRKFRNLT